MRTTFKILNTAAGGDAVGSYSLRFRNVLKVKYEGKGYDLIYGLIPTPGVRQVQYISSFGIFKFWSGMSFPPGGKVYIYYAL